MERMDIGNVIRRVLRQWLLFVLIGAIAAFGWGIAARRLYRPQYQTSAVIVVYERGSTRGTSGAQETAKVFQEVINSSLLQKKVAQALGLESLPGSISCSGIPNTNMITLRASAQTPRDAMTVMNGILEHYGEVTEKLLEDMVLEVLEEPKVPMQAVEEFDAKRQMTKVFLIFCAGSAFLLAMYLYLRDDIKNADEVERKLDTKLFAEVLHEKQKAFFHIKKTKRRKKAGLLVSDPVTSFGYTETFQKICMKVDYKAGSKGRKVLLVTSVQENEGKSTVSANLALSFAKRGKKVLLVDADLRKPAQFKLFGLTYAKGEAQIGSVLAGRADWKEALRKIPHTALCVLGGSRSYKNSTRLLVGRGAADVFAQLSEDVDYVIIDTPPLYAAADAEELMRYADAGLLVVRQNVSKVRDINDAIDLFAKTGCKLLGCILNDVENGIFGSVSVRSDGYQNRYGYGYGYYRKAEPKEKG